MASVAALKFFRDAVHDYITFDSEDARLLKVVDSYAFQRLRRIHQNGAGFLAYHGLEATRFGHALGTFEIARKVMRALQESQEEIASRLGPYRLLPDTATAFRAACLLHDIGHPCLSHLGERFFQAMSPEVKRHEYWTRRIVQEDEEIRRALELEDWYPDLIAFLEGDHPFTYLQNLFSGNLDVDRFDYLNRDTMFSGAGYGLIDTDWLIRSMTLDVSEFGYEGPDVAIVFDWTRGSFAVEHFLLSRRAMYAQVYFHRTARAAEALVISILMRAVDTGRYGESAQPAPLPSVFGNLARGEETSVEEYLRLDDSHILRSIVEWSRPSESDDLLHDLCVRFMKRDIFKAVPVPKEVHESRFVGTQKIASEERLKEVIISGSDLPDEVTGTRDSVDYYYALDICETSIYDPGPKSIILSRKLPGGRREYFPLEADTQIGTKFAIGSSSERDYKKALVIVPSEARSGVRSIIEEWRAAA